jgi:hypothetical protein
VKKHPYDLSDVPDEELLTRLEELVAEERATAARLRTCVAELKRFGIEISAFDQERLDDLLDEDHDPEGQ